MIAYLIFASASLLGYSGGFVVMTAFEVYDVRISWPTFFFIMYNFALVGVVAVFYQKVGAYCVLVVVYGAFTCTRVPSVVPLPQGVPRIVTQSYLVAVSCIMAWIVVKLPEVRARTQRGFGVDPLSL